MWFGLLTAIGWILEFPGVGAVLLATIPRVPLSVASVLLFSAVAWGMSSCIQSTFEFNSQVNTPPGLLQHAELAGYLCGVGGGLLMVWLCRNTPLTGGRRSFAERTGAGGLVLLVIITVLVAADFVIITGLQYVVDHVARWQDERMAPLATHLLLGSVLLLLFKRRRLRELGKTGWIWVGWVVAGPIAYVTYFWLSLRFGWAQIAVF